MSEKTTRIRPITTSFELPKTIASSLRRHSKAVEEGTGDTPHQVKYIWIHLGEPEKDATGSAAGAVRMGVDDWLNVVDESAALGAESVFISVDTELSDWPELWEICRWAQNTHNMLVAICVCEAQLSPEQLRELKELDHEKTRLYVSRQSYDSMRYVEEFGIKVFVGEVLEVGAVQHSCSMAKSMVCVGSEGAMYTCGLVLNDEHFHLGNACSERLERVMGDESLPHIIPEGIAVTDCRCHACPPLMEKRLEEKAE